ncbi:hypothetical protein PMAYCL1PPCAC_22200, partial [Pristionchus mayeri]
DLTVKASVGETCASTCDCLTNVFKKQGIIAEEDHISNLPDDCLLEILKLCDHDDLDELSCISQRLYAITIQSRKHAVKERWNMLVKQFRPNGDRSKEEVTWSSVYCVGRQRKRADIEDWKRYVRCFG